MIYKTLGDRLKYCLEKRGMSQREFAARINTTEATVSRWIYGTRQPKADAIVVICQKLGISSDWLLGLM